MAPTTGHCSEWTAAALRPRATWVPVTGPDGRTRMEMVWSLPSVDMADVTNPAGTSTAA